MEFIHSALTRLTQRYGLPLIYVSVELNQNAYPQSGVRTPTSRTEYAIPKALHLNVRNFKDYLGKLGLDFQESNSLRVRLSKYIILPEYLPPNPRVGDYIIANGKRYNVIEVDLLQDSQSYVFKTAAADNEPLNRSHKITIRSVLRFRQTVSHE